MAKHVSQSGRWRVIIDPAEDSAIEMENLSPNDENGSTKKQQKERKRANEIYLADGDLLIWKRMSDGEDDFLSALNRQYGDVYQSSSSRAPSRGAQRERAKEVGLSIDDDGW